MRYISFLGLLIFASAFFSCTDNTTPVNGYPEDVLQESLYNKLQKEYTSISIFDNSISVVTKGNKKGAINAKGKEILPCKYSEISDSYDGVRILVCDEKYGIMDSKGKISVPCQYEELKTPSNGLIAAFYNNKWGIIDYNNEIKVQFKYDDIVNCYDAYFIAKYHDQYGISSYEDQTLIDFIYDYVAPSHHDEDFIYVIKNNKCGIYNADFKKLYDPVYDRSLSYWTPSNGVITTRKDGLYGAIECKTGKILIPFVYNRLGDYKEGLFYAQSTDTRQFGYIDRENKTVIQFKYTSANDFSEGYAVVAVYDKKFESRLGTVSKDIYGVIDKDGNWVIKPTFGDPLLGITNPQFGNGLCPMGLYDKNRLGASQFGYINIKGEWVIPPLFDEVQNFINGVAEVSMNGKWGAINTKGLFIVPTTYDDDYPRAKDDSFILVKGKEHHTFDLEGNLLTKE